MSFNVSTIQRIDTKIPIIENFPIKLELGSGENKKDGFVGLDIDDYGQKIIWDLEKGLPLPDNSCSRIYASHVFEHLEDLIGIFNECWRVLQTYGKLHVIVPEKNHLWAYNPSHIQFFTKRTFKFFATEQVKIYNCRKWEILKLILNERKDIHAWMSPIEK